MSGMNLYIDQIIRAVNSSQSISWGTGAPEGVVTATVGSIYLRDDGAPNATAYVKSTGSGNTGWAALGSSTLIGINGLALASLLRLRVPYFQSSGTTGQWSTPNSVALQVTTTIDIQARVQITNYAPSGFVPIMSKWNGGNRSYGLGISTNGVLDFRFSPDSALVKHITGTKQLKNVIPQNRPVWLRALANPNIAGAASATFSFSLDGVTWTTIETATNVTPGPWAATPAAVTIGDDNSGGSMTGRIYRGRIYSGDSTSGGTLLADFDSRYIDTNSPAAFTGADSLVWTPNSTTNGIDSAHENSAYNPDAQPVTASLTLVDGSAPIVVTDLTSAAATITLPAAPTTGSYFRFADTTGQWATHNLTINPNGKNIDGSGSNVTLSTANGQVGYFYDGTQWHSFALTVVPDGSITAAKFSGNAGERALVLGFSGASTGASMADCADIPIIVPFDCTVKRVKAITKVAPSGGMTVTIRRSTNHGSTYTDVTNLNPAATFVTSQIDIANTPTATNLSEGDILGLSLGTATGFSGLVVELVIVPR